MKNVKTLLAAAVAASAIAAPAMAEVSGSVAIASTYLWRGYDLGSGTPAVSGDLSYSEAGAYAGIWGSSGDTSAGTEYDLYAGYGMEMDMVTIDLSVWNYNYPTGPGYTADGETDFGDLTDVILTIGVGPVTFAYYEPVAGGYGFTGYNYYTLSAGFGAFSVTAGYHHTNGNGADNDNDDDPVHVNVDYAFNDNLTFTLSQFVADETNDDDLKFVVSYSLPL